MRQAILMAVFAVLGFEAFAVAQQNQPDQKSKVPSVRRVAFSPDGKSLAVAHSVINSLVVWDLATRERKFVITEKSAIQSVCYSPFGTALAISTGKVIKLLDPASGEVRGELAGHENTVRSVSFASNGKQLATASNDRTVKLWDIGTGKVIRTLDDWPGNLVSVAFSADGKWLAAACDGDSPVVRLWSIDHADRPPHKFETGDAYVPQVVFSSDSRQLAIPNWQGSVWIIDVAAGQEVLRFTNVGGANCVAFSPEGRWMAIATNGKPLNLVPYQQSTADAQFREIAALIENFNDNDYPEREAASQKLAEFGMPALTQLRAALESPVAEVRVRCRRLIQRMQNTEYAVKLVGHEAEPSWAAFSPDGKLLASGDWQGMVKLWDVSDAKVLATLEPE